MNLFRLTILAVFIAFFPVLGSAQGQVPATKQTGEVELRVWTDATGRHQIRATLVEAVDGALKLRKEDGRVITVPIEKLSKVDQEYAAQSIALRSGKKPGEKSPIETGDKPASEVKPPVSGPGWGTAPSVDLVGRKAKPSQRFLIWPRAFRRINGDLLVLLNWRLQPGQKPIGNEETDPIAACIRFSSGAETTFSFVPLRLKEGTTTGTEICKFGAEKYVDGEVLLFVAPGYGIPESVASNILSIQPNMPLAASSAETKPSTSGESKATADTVAPTSVDKKPTYLGPEPVPASGLAIDAMTELTKGMTVLASWSEYWYAVEILELLVDGQVKVHYRGWESKWDEVVPRSRLQFLPSDSDKQKPVKPKKSKD